MSWVCFMRRPYCCRYAQLVNYFTQQRFSDGDVIIKQGDVGTTFYLLAEGQVTVTKDGVQVRALAPPLLRRHPHAQARLSHFLATVG